MLTHEELVILRNQFSALQAEKKEMQDEISAYRQANIQIRILQKECQDLEMTISKEDKKFRDEIAILTQNVSFLNDKLKGNTQKIQSWDVKKLKKKELKLNEIKEKENQNDEEISKLDACILKLKNELKEINDEIASKCNIIKKYKIILNKTGSFSSLDMKINELLNLRELLKQQNINISKNIEFRNSSKADIQKNNSMKMESLKKLEGVVEENVCKINELKAGLDELNNNDLIFKKKQLDDEVHLKELEYKNELDISEKLIKEMEEEKLKLKNEKTSIENNIDKMNKSIQQSKINIDVIANKKNALINQLKKSIQEKTTDIIRSRSTSPYVQRLIESQEKHWIEKQKLIEQFNKVKSEHEKISEHARNKAIVLDEIVSYIEESRRVPTDNPMTNLNCLYKYAREKNKTLARAIFVLEREMKK